MKLFFAIFAQSTFWLWNFLFVYIVYLGILPTVGWPLIQAIALGQVPTIFAISLALLLLVPVCAIGLGLRFIKQPRKILSLFYGVEIPLFLLCLVRLFALRELSPAGNWLLGSLLLSMGAFGLYLIRGYARQRGWAIAQAILHSLMLLMGLYGGSLLLFYAIPSAYVLLEGFFSFSWVSVFWDALRQDGAGLFLAAPAGLILLWLSATLLITAPVMLVGLYIQTGQEGARQLGRQWGRGKAIALGLATLATWCLVLNQLNHQPQTQAFALLKTAASTPQQEQQLLRQSDRIRQGLLNAYLADYRYISSVKDNNHIQNIYEQTFPESGDLPQRLQSLYSQLFSPFLYQSQGQNDAQKAAKLYAQFFDQPIQKAESVAIRKALNATANRDQAKAGLLNINQEKVLLAQQRLDVTERGDWAEVELHEVYKNQTNDVQEVYYSFSLPESAVLTGLWLGDTADLSQRFQPQVSPRGAAQKVYNSQVQRVNPVDPALLEQVGPRHYRLRAFPVPPQVPGWAADGTRLENQPTEMHLWMTYQVMKTDQGWPLPQLGEKRNIFWTGKTQRWVNGERVNGERLSPSSQGQDPEPWLPAFLLAQSQAPPEQHHIELEGYGITAQPLQPQDYVLPQGQRWAIVLDRSRSMAQHPQELAEAFQWLKHQGFADNQFNNNDADLFLTAASQAQPERLDDLRQFNPAQVSFYGSLELKTMLQQFDQLKGKTAYDGIVVLTDGDTYELSTEGGQLPAVEAPLWMVHLGKLPPAYDDGVLKLMQDSGGGAERAIAPVLQRAATQAKLSAQTVVDGYAWSVQALAKPSNGSIAPDVTPLAARQLIQHLSRRLDTTAEALDGIHRIAKQHQIVTPYSSMIVLVNDEQRRLLAEAEAAADRFDRTVESGEETLEKPFNPLQANTSVPEPSPLTPVLTAGVVLWLMKKRKPMGAPKIRDSRNR